MTTKEKLLALLEAQKGTYYSGEEIAQRLEVSRAAVWKAVKSLQKEGYEIHAVTNRGYCLSRQTDILSKQGIQKFLTDSCRDLELSVLPTAESTNTLVREQANRGTGEGYTVIAGEQTGGRGRYGRSFFSPQGTGVYLSILLRPKTREASQALMLTTMAAVAMCEAIEEVSPEKAEIKWVNDIYVRGKKVCGILTEASLDLESSSLQYAVLGVGVNVYQPLEGFPGELAGTAGAVLEGPVEEGKNRLTASFLNHFLSLYRSGTWADCIGAYRERNLALGKTVTVRRQDTSRTAYVRDIDELCRLVVEYEDGTTEHLSYGEISIERGEPGA